jgi:putative transposase
MRSENSCPLGPVLVFLCGWRQGRQGLKPVFIRRLFAGLKARSSTQILSGTSAHGFPFWHALAGFVISLADVTVDIRKDHWMDFERTFFITTITAGRLPIFRRDPTAKLLIDTLAHYREQKKFFLHEFVIMPDHIHALLTPAPEISLERAMQFIKGGFSFRLKSKGAVWQASFTNHRIRNLEDFESHCDYIRMNPVRARLAPRPEPYPYCSASGALQMDKVPQGLKPHEEEAALTRR